jgi:hypothetical protein
LYFAKELSSKVKVMENDAVIDFVKEFLKKVKVEEKY